VPPPSLPTETRASRLLPVNPEDQAALETGAITRRRGVEAPSRSPTSSAIVDRQEPQRVPAPVHSMTCETEQAPSLIASRISRSQTPMQRQTYMQTPGYVTGGIDIEHSFQYRSVKGNVARADRRVGSWFEIALDRASSARSNAPSSARSNAPSSARSAERHRSVGGRGIGQGCSRSDRRKMTPRERGREARRERTPSAERSAA
jgi:hypothetical protein